MVKLAEKALADSCGLFFPKLKLIKRLVDASNFNVAYACLRQISFGLLDMAWYTHNTPFEGDVKAYEQEAWKDAQILPVVQEACMSTQFSHIFAGGYAAGYYLSLIHI